MKTTRIAALLVAQCMVACGSSSGPESTEAPPGSEPVRVEAPTPPVAEKAPNPLEMGKQGTTDELLAALARNDGSPVFVVLRAGTLIDGEPLGEDQAPVANALRLVDPQTVAVEFLWKGTEKEASVPLAAVAYLKELDHLRLGQEFDRAVTVGADEITDFDLDEAARRIGTPVNGVVPAVEKDFDCIARFARISTSRDYIPFPLTNCSAPQDPVGDPERIADAVKAKAVAQNIYNKMVADYNNAQAMIAALRVRLAQIQNAYAFIHHDPAFKEYNILHFKNFLHGRKSFNSRFDRAERLLRQAAADVQAQIDAYSQVPVPSVPQSRSQANAIVARKWNCTLGTGLLNNGGRSGSTIVGVSLETLGAPFVDIQVMLDDHPPLPQKDGWGGLFDVTPTANLNTDVTRLPVSAFVPVRATVGLPIVMFRFQPLDAKKTRPVGKACNLRAGIVL